MKSILPINRVESRVIISGLFRYLMRDRRRSLWASLLCLSLCSGFISPAVSAKVPKRAAKAKVVKATVTNIEVRKRATSAATAKNTMPVSVEISGKGFGKTLTPASVTLVLTNIESGEPSSATVTFASDSKIFAHAELPTGEEASIRSSFGLGINGKSVDTKDYLFEIPVEKPVEPKPRSVGVDIKEFNNPQNPTLHSVLISPTDDSDTFAYDPTDPKAMKVQILPPGATNVVIDPVSNSRSTLITFTAADGFKVQDVLVTVYDSSASRPTGATSKKAAPKQADKEVKITKVDVLSLQRRDGFGRLKIEGEGFGNYGAVAGEGELELLCDSRNRTSQVEELSDTPEKRQQLNQMCMGKPYFIIRRDPANKSENDNTAYAKTTSSSNPSLSPSPSPTETWQSKIQKGLNVEIVPRNSDFRIERTKVLYANDKVIDVYFEFTHFKDFSEPFRLSSVTVTVTEGNSKNSDQANAAGSEEPGKTYITSADINRGNQLEYRYSVLDEDDATRLFGAGVGKRFYTVQLSVVNHGENKVLVPLSSIQAEIEWAYQDGGDKIFYDEGPSTISPFSLPTVTGSFNAYQRVHGRKAKLFNFLDGLQTLAGTMVPVFGRSIERPTSILASGFVPGLRQALGDLSGEQLQRLTAMSWETVEEIPAKHSVEKYIYIQRSDENYSGSTDPKIKRQIKSIAGFEVNGFEVTKSAETTASKQ